MMKRKDGDHLGINGVRVTQSGAMEHPGRVGCVWFVRLVGLPNSDSESRLAVGIVPFGSSTYIGF